MRTSEEEIELNRNHNWHLTCSDSLVVRVHVSIELQDRQVVVKVPRVVLGMDDHSEDVILDVWIEFSVPVHVPLAETDAKVLSLIPVQWGKKRRIALRSKRKENVNNAPFQAMGSGQNVARSDQSATADVDVVGTFLAQHGRMPRILAELGVALYINGRLDSPRYVQWAATPTGANRVLGTRVAARSRRATAHLERSASWLWRAISAVLPRSSVLFKAHKWSHI